METLSELREWFLSAPEERAHAFKVADYYLVKYDEDPDMFVLPREHIYAKPVVEAFAGDTLGYAKWLREMLSTYVVRGSEVGQLVGQVAKDAQSRGINRRKRFLENEAIRQAVFKRMIQDTPLEKLRYKRRVSEAIKREYKALLDGVRSRTQNGRITHQEREQLVTQFWDDLLQRYTSGDIPEA